MKHFLIYCCDAPGTTEVRAATNPAHLQHVEAHLDRYWVAGPLRDTQGETVGSMLIVKAESATEARLFLEQDPYYAANLWQSIEIHDFLPAAGEWIGGKIW